MTIIYFAMFALLLTSHNIFGSILMMSKKNYRVVLAAVLSPFSLCAMYGNSTVTTYGSQISGATGCAPAISKQHADQEKREASADACFEMIRKRINTDQLGVGQESWCRDVIASCVTVYQNYGLSDKEVVDEFKRIQSYIPQNKSTEIIKKLNERHWHVTYLMQTLVYNKVKQLGTVKGSTIDMHVDPVKSFPDLSENIATYIFSEVKNRYVTERATVMGVPDFLLSIIYDAFLNSKGNLQELIKFRFSKTFLEVHRLDAVFTRSLDREIEKLRGQLSNERIKELKRNTSKL
jgi:hypothetical protein